MPDIEVVYADDALVVLNKPADLLSVPGRGEDKQDCLSRRVQERYPNACVVHRLDMATSGLLLMARSAAVQRQLNAAFAARTVHKRYEAVVTGRLEPEADASDAEGWQRINLPICVDWPNRPRRIIDPIHGKPSQTRWRVLELTDQTTRLALEPVTGRSHQLRVHLQAIGHPILGDALYAPAAVAAQTTRLLLHASGLRLLHPLSGEPLHLVSPAPF